MKEFKQMDAQLWTNDCFVDWFNLVSLNVSFFLIDFYFRVFNLIWVIEAIFEPTSTVRSSRWPCCR